MDSSDKALRHNQDLVIDFSVRYEAIIGRGLDARSVDTYADQALEDLVDLVEDALTMQPAESAADDALKAERERTALECVGLDSNTIENTLDHIAAVAESTRRIDQFIMRKRKLVDAVLVSPDRRDMSVTSGDGSFELPRPSIPKLKTLMLLLEQEFGIDISPESDEVQITGGALRGNMMRGRSYDMVEIPSLDRLVLVCDEVGNTTFVFDTEQGEKSGLSVEDLSNASKDTLRDLIQNTPRLGRQINYSKSYVNMLATALESSLDDAQDVLEPKALEIQLLKPKADIAPEGYLSVAGMSKALSIDHKSLDRIIATLGDELGDTIQARFRSTVTTAYAPKQQEVIRQYVITQKVPEGYLSVGGMAQEFGTGFVSIARAVTALDDILGDVRRAKFGAQFAIAYSPEQQAMIREYLSKKGTLAQIVPDGYLSVNGVRKDLNLAHEVVNNAITALGDALGGTIQAKFGPQTSIAYSPEQQAKIREYLAEKGVFARKPPEGYLSVSGIRKALGADPKTIGRAIEALGDSLGGTIQAKFTSNTSTAYSPEQQAKIREWLEQNSRAPLNK